MNINTFYDHLRILLFTRPVSVKVYLSTRGIGIIIMYVTLRVIIAVRCFSALCDVINIDKMCVCVCKVAIYKSYNRISH